MTRMFFGLIAPPALKKHFNFEEDTLLAEKVLHMLSVNYPSLNNSYVLGERFSICDIMLFCEIMQMNMAGYDM